MPPDLWSLYKLMLKSRLFEEIIAKLWHDGLIAGEMHLGTGEESYPSLSPTRFLSHSSNCCLFHSYLRPKRKKRHRIGGALGSRLPQNSVALLTGYPLFSHIDYDKANNDPRNLIALHVSCHSKTNINRTYWQCMFTELRAMRYACWKAEVLDRLELEWQAYEQLTLLTLQEEGA